MLLTLLISLAGALVSNPPARPAQADAARLAAEGRDLYRRGQLGEALLKFEKAIEAGAKGGDLFYQTGFCYRAVRNDAEKSVEYMRKAVPLLEAATKDRPKGPAPFYYLASALINDLSQPDRGKEAARRGTALADEGRFNRTTDAESLFQIGRLYALAGQPDKERVWYEKALPALQAEKDLSRQYLLLALEKLAEDARTAGHDDKSVDLSRRLLALEPGRDDLRMSTGRLLLKLGRYKDAIDTLRGFVDDDMATEGNYVMRCVSRYVELGTPSPPPEWAKKDDAAIEEALAGSTTKLQEIRKREAEKNTRTPPTEPQYDMVPTKRGKMRKVPRPVDPEVYRLPPPTPERIEEEKVFFGLLVEMARRGRPLRELALSRGLTGLIFR